MLPKRKKNAYINPIIFSANSLLNKVPEKKMLFEISLKILN